MTRKSRFPKHWGSGRPQADRGIQRHQSLQLLGHCHKAIVGSVIGILWSQHITLPMASSVTDHARNSTLYLRLMLSATAAAAAAAAAKTSQSPIASKLCHRAH